MKFRIHFRLLCSIAIIAVIGIVAAGTVHASSWRYELPIESDGVMLMDDLIYRVRLDDDITKAKRVNRFFNQILVSREIGHAVQSPEELVQAGRGSQLDIAVAKLFALEAAGIPAHRMSVTRVRHHDLDGMHVLLLVYPGSSSEPIVLDTLTREIQWLSDRPGLFVVDMMSHQDVSSILNQSRQRLAW